MVIKTIIVLALLAIVANLFHALVLMYKDQGGGARVARALTWRIGLAIALFVFLLAAYRLGWITGYTSQ